MAVVAEEAGVAEVVGEAADSVVNGIRSEISGNFGKDSHFSGI